MSSVEERARAFWFRVNYGCDESEFEHPGEWSSEIDTEVPLLAELLRAEHAHCLAELRQGNTPVTMSAEMLDELLKQERLKVLTERRDLYREGSDCWRAFNGALRDELAAHTLKGNCASPKVVASRG